MGKKISNIGVLDLTSTTEENINQIESIENVGALVYSSSTATLATKIPITNLGMSDEIPENCKIIQGQIELNKNYFENIKEPIAMYISGQIIIKPDVTADNIEKGIGFLDVNGQLICPEKLAGILQSKCKNINGKVLTYDSSYSVNIGKISINDSFLQSINDSSSLALIGKVNFIDDIDTALFEKKVSNIDIVGAVSIKEEYLNMFNKKMHIRDGCHVETIPLGYTYIGEDLHLNSISIKRFKNARLYISGMLEFDRDITGEMLKGRIDSIKAKDIIVCSRDLTEAVFDLCKDVTTIIADYSGKACVIDGEHRLTQSELKYAKEDITYIVQGSLTIDKDITPDLFLQKVEHIDNLGEIICSSEMYGLVQSKLRISSGEISDGTQNDEDSNIGYLKL
ncbi:MAG: hypothetical protein QME45_05360 [Clostridiales bacterium]|nr:hypothetical protein [Clostridiales bacterium]